MSNENKQVVAKKAGGPVNLDYVRETGGPVREQNREIGGRVNIEYGQEIGGRVNNEDLQIENSGGIRVGGGVIGGPVVFSPESK